MAELPRQSDVVPEQPPAPPPSIGLYAGLAAIGGLMLAIALRGDAKLSDALVNLGTGLLEAVAILILVERRFRRSEVTAIKGLPRSLKVFLFLVRPSERQIYRYTRVFLAHVEPRVKDVQDRPELDKHSNLFESGGVLLGKPGSGKTTWLQSISATRAQTFLADPQANKAPILFPLRNWLPDRTLEEALREHVTGFSPLSVRNLRRGMKNARFLVILDGADEASGRISPSLKDQLAVLGDLYPKVTWVVSSRPYRLSPVNLSAVVNISPPTPEEIADFKRRMHLD